MSFWKNIVGALGLSIALGSAPAFAFVAGDIAVYEDVTGTRLIDSGIPAVAGTNILSNTTTAVLSSYTATNSDDHAVLNLNSSGAANQTVTVNTLGSYTDTHYTLGVCNRDSRPWKIVSTDAGTLKLYPGQCNMLLPKAGQLAYWRPFEPWRVTATQNIWTGPAGSCNDSNDGFDSTASGAICNWTTLVALVQGEFTCNGNAGLVIRIADGSYNQQMFLAGPPPNGCGDQIPITGHVGNPGAVGITCPVASHCFDIEDHMITTITGLTVICTNATGIFGRGLSIIDINGVVSNDCTGGTVLSMNDGAHANLLSASALDINGNASNALIAKGPGALISMAPGNTLVVTSSAISVTAFATVVNQGQIFTGPGQISGGGSVTGQKWFVDSLGLISTNGSGSACDSFFNNVGTSAGAATNGGICH